jgi:hypothetical protein
MKFTESADGVERANVWIRLRFDRGQIKAFKVLAEELGWTWREWVQFQAGQGNVRGQAMRRLQSLRYPMPR